MSDEEKIREIYQWLLEKYGEPENPRDISGVDYVIETIMSQNTNDVSRDKAFNKLKEKYGDDYGSIETADKEELADTIRLCGLGPTKAERIQTALKTIREEVRNSERVSGAPENSSEEFSDTGEYSIEFLGEKSVEDAKKWLTDIPGIGPKTAAVILGFYFRMPVFPVDTHVHRLCKRYGLVPENSSRKQTYEIMEEKVPDEIKYPFHILLITHGREECSARKDDCQCVLCQKYG